jgi:hypothetical protein
MIILWMRSKMGIILILLIILPILLRLDAYVADPYNCDFTMRTLTHVGVEGLLTIALVMWKVCMFVKAVMPLVIYSTK